MVDLARLVQRLGGRCELPSGDGPDVVGVSLDSRDLGAGELFGWQSTAGPGLEAVDMKDVLDADRHPEEERSRIRLGVAVQQLGRLAKQPFEPIGLGKKGADPALDFSEP